MKSTRTPLSRLAAISAGTLLAGATALPAAAQTTTPAQPPAGSLPAAAASGSYTLRRAVDVALQNNLTIRQQQLATQNTDAILRQSRAALLPSINGSGTQNWNYGTSIDPLTNQFTKDLVIRSNNFSINSQVTLFSGFQLRNTIKRNVLDYEAGLNDIEKSKNDISLNVASSFLQLVLAQELVLANQARVNSSQQQVERTRKLLKAGSVAESNLLDGQAQQASDELNVITAQNQVAFYSLQLAQLLNLNSTTGFAIEVPTLPDPDEEAQLIGNPDGTYQTAQELMPEVKAADLRTQSALRSVEVARGGYLPRLTLGGGIFTGYSSSRATPVATGEFNDTTLLPIYLIDPNTGVRTLVPGTAAVALQPKFVALPDGFFKQINANYGKQVQFALSVPILNGLQVRTNVQRSEIAVKQAELRAEQARLTLRQNIQQAYADAIGAQRKYSAAKRQVTALSTAYRNAEIRFNNGLLNGTDFNIAKNNLYGAESSMIQAKYEFIFRRKVLDFYEGRALDL